MNEFFSTPLGIWIIVGLVIICIITFMISILIGDHRPFIVSFCMFSAIWLFSIVCGVIAYFNEMPEPTPPEATETSLVEVMPPEAAAPSETTTESVRNCSNCGVVVQADQKYCSNCGSELQLFCSNCGQTVQPNQNYCSVCGNKLLTK